nr:IclR family transcriptional regulator C-terminal domain-containing protein [Komagataeibacter xylinus]
MRLTGARDQIEAVRLKGYALDLESYRPGQNAVAVPWREHGEVRAAIALTGSCADLPRPSGAAGMDDDDACGARHGSAMLNKSGFW